MKFAHGEVHRAGWDWWLKMNKEGKVDEVSIGHEIYEVDAGKWENIKFNAPPSDFGMFMLGGGGVLANFRCSGYFACHQDCWW